MCNYEHKQKSLQSTTNTHKTCQKTNGRKREGQSKPKKRIEKIERQCCYYLRTQKHRDQKNIKNKEQKQRKHMANSIMQHLYLYVRIETDTSRKKRLRDYKTYGQAHAKNNSPPPETLGGLGGGGGSVDPGWKRLTGTG